MCPECRKLAFSVEFWNELNSITPETRRILELETALKDIIDWSAPMPSPAPGWIYNIATDALTSTKSGYKAN